MKYGKLTDLWHQLAMEPRRFNWKWINLILLMIQKDISKPFIPSKNQQQQISLPPACQELISNSWHIGPNCWTVNGYFPGLTTADIRATFTFTLSHFHFHIQDWRQQISVPPVCQQKRRVWHWGDQSGEKQTKHVVVVRFTFVSIIHHHHVHHCHQYERIMSVLYGWL